MRPSGRNVRDWPNRCALNVGDRASIAEGPSNQRVAWYPDTPARIMPSQNGSSMGSGLSLPNRRILLVPGNHDFRETARVLWQETELGGAMLALHERFLGHDDRRFKAFARGIAPRSQVPGHLGD